MTQVPEFRELIERWATDPVQTRDMQGNPSGEAALESAGQQRAWSRLISMYREVENFNE